MIPRILGALAALLLIAPALPAAPAAAGYEQVVDLTFPLAPDVGYSYSDDYESPRSRGAHGATDIGAPTGTPVHAVVGGTVTTATGMGCGGSWTGGKDAPPSWGYALYIDGDDGRSYRYLHLGVQDQPASTAYAEGITCGTRVARGEHVGYVGHSGNAHPDWPHLHLEIHDESVSDPHGDPRINPYFSLRDAEARGDFPGAQPTGGLAQACAPPDSLDSEVPRLAGLERIGTADAVAAELWPDGASDVVVATSRDHADAIAGTALAAALDAPVLLATPDKLPERTAARITALGPETVWLLAGAARHPRRAARANRRAHHRARS